MTKDTRKKIKKISDIMMWVSIVIIVIILVAIPIRSCAVPKKNSSSDTSLVANRFEPKRRDYMGIDYNNEFINQIYKVSYYDAFTRDYFDFNYLSDSNYLSFYAPDVLESMGYEIFDRFGTLPLGVFVEFNQPIINYDFNIYTGIFSSNSSSLQIILNYGTGNELMLDLSLYPDKSVININFDDLGYYMTNFFIINRLNGNPSYTLNYSGLEVVSYDNQYNGSKYEEGYNNGRQEGYESGYLNGYDSGYVVGKNDGLSENGIGNFRTLIFSVIDSPFNAIKTWLNFDFLGFNMGTFFTGLFSLALVGFALSMIFKFMR